MAEPGLTVRADLTIAVDVATRTIGAAVLRPVGTKAVDAALLLARMLVPEPMRPGWAETLAMSASVLPHARLAAIDERMEAAAARPVIVPDTIVIDGGRVFISETFTRACARLGISVQRARPRTPTDKSVAEATFGSVNTLLAQHLAGYTGRNPDRRGDRVAEQAAWTVPDLQDLLDEWLVVWQNRPHDALRDPLFPRRAMSPNEKYAALVAAAGYLPVPLTGRGLPRAAAGDLAGDQRLRHPDRLPHLRPRGPGVLAPPAFGDHRPQGPVGSPLRPLRPDAGCSSGPRPGGSPPRGPTCRWCPRRSPTSPGGTPGSWPLPAGLDAGDQGQVARVLDDLLTRAAGRPWRAGQRPHRGPDRDRRGGRPALPAAEEKPDGDGGQDSRVIAWRAAAGGADGHLRRPCGGREMASDCPGRAAAGSGIPADSPLTTKEGWAAFVRHQPAPPQPLPAAGPADRAACDEARREYHADLPLVSTPVLQKVISTCRLLIQLNRHQVSARRGVIISGASGTGKTTALTQLGRTHELVTRSRHPGERPAAGHLRDRAARRHAPDARGRVRPVPRPGVPGPGQPRRHHQHGLRGGRPRARRPGPGR